MKILTTLENVNYFKNLLKVEPKIDECIDFVSGNGGRFYRADFGNVDQFGSLEVLEGDHFSGSGYLLINGKRSAKLVWGNVNFTAYPLGEV